MRSLWLRRSSDQCAEQDTKKQRAEIESSDFYVIDSLFPQTIEEKVKRFLSLA
jgi:hypothetical protein